MSTAGKWCLGHISISSFPPSPLPPPPPLSLPQNIRILTLSKGTCESSLAVATLWFFGAQGCTRKRMKGQIVSVRLQHKCDTATTSTTPIDRRHSPSLYDHLLPLERVSDEVHVLVPCRRLISSVACHSTKQASRTAGYWRRQHAGTKL